MPKTWLDLHLVCFGCLLFNTPPVRRDCGRQWNTYTIVVSDFFFKGTSLIHVATVDSGR